MQGKAHQMPVQMRCTAYILEIELACRGILVIMMAGRGNGTPRSPSRMAYSHQVCEAVLHGERADSLPVKVAPARLAGGDGHGSAEAMTMRWHPPRPQTSAAKAGPGGV
jgi:hypothetical protein